MNGKEYKEKENERGITAQTTASQKAKIDKAAYDPSKSPKMTANRVFSNTVANSPSMARNNTIIFKR